MGANKEYLRISIKESIRKLLPKKSRVDTTKRLTQPSTASKGKKSCSYSHLFLTKRILLELIQTKLLKFSCCRIIYYSSN